MIPVTPRTIHCSLPGCAHGEPGQQVQRVGRHREREEDHDNEPGREDELRRGPLPVVQGGQGPEQDQDERGDGDLHEDQDRDSGSRSRSARQEYEPCPCLDRARAASQASTLPQTISANVIGCRDQGLERLVLVLFGDQVDDKRGGDDRRHKDEERDQEPVHELVEVTAGR